QVHRGQRRHRHVSRPEALGGRGERGRLPEPGSRHPGPRPREDHRGAGRSGTDGAGPASRSDEYVCCPGEEQRVERRQELGGRRSEGVHARREVADGYPPDTCDKKKERGHCREGPAPSPKCLPDWGDSRERAWQQIARRVEPDLGKSCAITSYEKWLERVRLPPPPPS